MQERQKHRLLAAREKEIKKHLFDVRKRNKTLLKLRKLATLAIKFSTKFLSGARRPLRAVHLNPPQRVPDG